MHFDKSNTLKKIYLMDISYLKNIIIVLKILSQINSLFSGYDDSSHYFIVLIAALSFSLFLLIFLYLDIKLN